VKTSVFIITLIALSLVVLTGCRINRTDGLVQTDTSSLSLQTTLQTGASIVSSSTSGADATTAGSIAATTAVPTAEPTAVPTPAPASTTIADTTEVRPLTASDISALPAGVVVDDFLVSDDIIAGCFNAEIISDTVFARMDGNSYKKECTIPIDDLRYVRVLYYGFDGQVRTGELVVNKTIAEDIMAIFRALYDAKYPIGKMVLVDEYGGDDNLSMLDNNTSSFNYRVVNNSTTLSKHAQGLAIDINPLYNPWIYTLDGKTVIDPPAGEKYADRTLDIPYYIKHDDLCYKLFTEHGFTWGGDWESSKDYQHFSHSS
jgi:hypothetical protein